MFFNPSFQNGNGKRLERACPHDTHKKLHRRTQEPREEVTAKRGCKFVVAVVVSFLLKAKFVAPTSSNLESGTEYSETEDEELGCTGKRATFSILLANSEKV